MLIFLKNNFTFFSPYSKVRTFSRRKEDLKLVFFEAVYMYSISTKKSLNKSYPIGRLKRAKILL